MNSNPRPETTGKLADAEAQSKQEERVHLPREEWVSVLYAAGFVVVAGGCIAIQMLS